ncbi:SusC/RagA family TonB-linked outer membrane protein [Ferruginibacter sp.]
MNKVTQRLKCFLALLVIMVGFNVQVSAQTKVEIKGRVTDAATGKALGGASITEINANDRQVSGVSADNEGNYSLRITDTKNKMRFAFLGYESKVVEINGRTAINVSLMRDTSNKMDAVIVTYTKTQKVSNGFVSTAKRDLTGSVVSIKSDVIAEQPATSIDQMIQGRAAGVQVVSSSGDPGAGVDIRIRGASSIGSGNDPLYIIDGIPIISTPFDNTNSAQAGVARINPIADLNPLDIESIDILKDANASAIYGARAANGVIIVTTKRGKKNLTNITLNTQFGLQEAPPSIPVLNGSQYKVMRLEAEQNNGNINPYNDATRALLNDPTYFSYWYYQSDTKWLDYLTRLGSTKNFNLNVSGGGESVKYSFITSYNDQAGAFVNTGSKRFTGRFNLDYKVSDRLRFSANIYFARSKVNNYANYGQGSVYYIGLIKNPSMPVYDVDLNTGKPLQNYLSLGGIQGGTDNPVAFAKTVTNDAFSTNLKPNVRLEYDILKGLKFTSNTSLDFVGENGFLYLPSEATGLIWNDNNFNRIDTRDFERTQVIVDNLLSYNKSFKEDKFKTVFLLGNTFNSFTSSQLSESGYANPSSQIQTLNGPARVRSISTSLGYDNILSFFAKANVIYNDKLSFDFTMRRDGSSKFGDSKKFGNFPSVGAYWRVSSEPFIRKNFTFISDLKLRASWGQLGNSNIPNYAYISQYSAGANYLGYTGITQSNAQLNNLQWEVVEQTNLGFDLEMFKSRLIMSVDVYNKETKKLLYQLALPSSSGILGPNYTTGGTIYTNLGNIQNRGIEVDLNYDILKSANKNKLRWNAAFNIARNMNKVTKLPGGTITYTGGTGGFVNQVKEGDPLGTYYGYRYLGVYATDADAIVRDAKGGKVYEADGVTPKYMKIGAENGNPFKGGDAIYEDFNHDGIIDDQDKILIGNANPLFFGGLNNRFDYKNLSFSFFIQYQYGNDIINNLRYNLEKMNSTDNQAVSVLRRWRKQGDVTDIPRALASDTRNSLASSRWVENGSYARLKFVTLAYRFPAKMIQRIKLKSVDAFITANNLFTWTDYKGADPEIGISGSPSFIGVDSGLSPQTKGYTLGINMRF